MARLLGAALWLGSILIGGILVWVLNTYRQEGQITDGWLAFIGFVVAAILILPQLGLGFYLWRTPRPPKDEP